MSADLAGILADLPEPERLPPGRLSNLQRAILAATAVGMYNDWDGDDPADLSLAAVPRRTVRDLLERYYWQTDPDRSHAQQVRSWHASFNRSLATLHERGYIDGLALAWVLITHERGRLEDIHGWQGAGRKRRTSYGTDRRPTLKRIMLSDKGWAALRLDGRPIGDLLPDRDTIDDRLQEAEWEDERARLLVEWMQRGDL